MYSMVCILKMDRRNPMIPNTEGQEVMHDESAKPCLQSELKSGPWKLTKNGQISKNFKCSKFAL